MSKNEIGELEACFARSMASPVIVHFGRGSATTVSPHSLSDSVHVASVAAADCKNARESELGIRTRPHSRSRPFTL